jgi:hypothetical protein
VSRHIIAKNSSAQKLHGIYVVDDGIEIPDFKCLKGLCFYGFKCFNKVLTISD